MKRFALMALLGLAACTGGQTNTPQPPSVAFGSFTTGGGASVGGESPVVPPSFTATLNLGAGDGDRITAVQCFLDGVPVASSAATGCAYTIPAPYKEGGYELKATVTTAAGLSASATKRVAVDAAPPVIAEVRVGAGQLDPASTTATASVTAGSTVSLSARSSSSDVVRAFIEVNGRPVASVRGNAVQASVSVPAASEGSTAPPLEVVYGFQDAAGNVTRYAVQIGVRPATGGDGVPPTARVTTPANNSAVSGSITIVAEATDANSIRNVQLLVNNNPVGSPDNEFPFTFSLDTTVFNNGPLEIKVRATDTSGEVATSAPITLTVNNVQAPVLSITAPSNGNQVTGSVPVSISVLKRASDFTYLTNIIVEVIDFRGTVVISREARPAVAGQPGVSAVYQTDPIDFNALRNDRYTIRAFAQVNVVGGQANPTTVGSSIEVRTQNVSASPPAVVILDPTRINELQTILPVFRQRLGTVFVEVSDNLGVKFVELTATCDSCAANNGPVNALVDVEAFMPPATSARVALDFKMDSTPFLPDGDYTLRVVAEDTEGNRNIQEVKARLVRDDAYRLPYGTTVLAGPDNLGDKLSPGSATFSVTGLVVGHSYQITYTLFRPGGARTFDTRSFVAAAATAGITYSFSGPGTHLFSAQVEDKTDGRIDTVGYPVPGTADSIVVVKLP